MDSYKQLPLLSTIKRDFLSGKIKTDETFALIILRQEKKDKDFVFSVMERWRKELCSK